MPALYRCRAARSELHDLFGCRFEGRSSWPTMIWPGRNAPVIRLNNGHKLLELMRWGMPAPEGSARPVRWAERNLYSELGFRKGQAAPGRCLVPMDSFAIPEGRRGKRTRSWLGHWEQEVFAWAGLCRDVPGQGLCFLGMTREANDLVGRVGRSMPVILDPTDWDAWLTAPVSELRTICRRCYPEGALWLEQTSEAWTSGIDLDADVPAP